MYVYPLLMLCYVMLLYYVPILDFYKSLPQPIIHSMHRLHKCSLSLLPVLLPSVVATEILASDAYPSLSAVMPLIVNLCKYYLFHTQPSANCDEVTTDK